MKKIIYTSYGDPEVMQVSSVPMPNPGNDEVLIKVMAAGINPVDYKIRDGSMKYIAPGKFPRTPGGEIAGIIEKVGSGALKFKPGEKVFAMLGMKGGGYSEYLCVKEKLISQMPASIDFEHAAAIPLAGLTALQALRDKGEIEEGMRVLINGASGGVGSLGIQIAKAFASEVTAVCSGKNSKFVKQLGADHVIDYHQEDFTKSSRLYDIVFDAVAKSSAGKCAGIIKPGGTYITTVPGPGVMLKQILNPLRPRKAYGILTHPGGKDLDVLAKMISEGNLVSHIEKIFSLQEAPQAHRYMETGHVKGKLVIKMTH